MSSKPSSNKDQGNPWERLLTDIWYKNKPAGIHGLWLSPLAAAFSSIRQLSRQSSKVQQAKSPLLRPAVLVVGNLIAGGAGKTPIVKAVCDVLTSQGKKVGVISRGYKRQGESAKHVLYVSPKSQLQASEIGDEPAWLAEQTGCPICVSSDRLAALNELVAMHPDLDLVISDDGLQHHRLPRTLEWVVFDNRGAGNGKLLPAGPLREPLARLCTVEAIISSQQPVEMLATQLGTQSDARWFETMASLNGFVNHATNRRMSVAEMEATCRKCKSLAFTGLANPDKFFSMLNSLGLLTHDQIGLPDHFQFPKNFLDDMDADILLTTGKDAVKLPRNNDKLWVAEISVSLPTALLEQIYRVC